MSLWDKLVNVLKTEPNEVLYCLNALLAMLVAWGVQATPTQTGAILTIATAVITIITTAMTRPVQIALITGAATTVLTAAATFGFHLSTAQISTGVTVLSIVLALLLRQNVTPVANLAKKQ